MIFRAFFATMSKQGGPNWTNVRWAHSVSVLMLRRHLPAILMVHSGKSPPPPPIRASWNQNQIISLLPSCHWTAYDTVIKVGPPLTKEWHYNLKWAVETGECFGAGSAKLQLLRQPAFWKVCWAIHLRRRWKLHWLSILQTNVSSANFFAQNKLIIIFDTEFC